MKRRGRRAPEGRSPEEQHEQDEWHHGEEQETPGQQRSPARKPKAVRYATGRHGRGGAKNLLQAAFTLFSH